MATGHGQLDLAGSTGDDMEVSSNAGRHTLDDDESLIDYSVEDDEERRTTHSVHTDEHMLDGEVEPLNFDENMEDDGIRGQATDAHNGEHGEPGVRSETFDYNDINLDYLDDEPAPIETDSLKGEYPSTDPLKHHNDSAPNDSTRESVHAGSQNPAKEESLTLKTSHDPALPVIDASAVDSVKKSPFGDDLEPLQDFYDYGDDDSDAEANTEKVDNEDFEGDSPAQHEVDEPHNLQQSAQHQDNLSTESNIVGKAQIASPQTFDNRCEIMVYADPRFFDIEEQPLFPTVLDETIQSGFLEEVKLFKKPLKFLIARCRDHLHMEELDMFQLVLRFDCLDLQIREDSTSASMCCLENIVDVYTALWQNQGVDCPDALYMGITAERSFYKQFDHLRSSSNEGKTFDDVTQYEQSYAGDESDADDADEAAEQGDNAEDAQASGDLDQPAFDEEDAWSEGHRETPEEHAETITANDLVQGSTDDHDSTLYHTTLEESHQPGTPGQQDTTNDSAQLAASGVDDAHADTAPPATELYEDEYPYEDPETADYEDEVDHPVDASDGTKTEIEHSSLVAHEISGLEATNGTSGSATNNKAAEEPDFEFNLYEDEPEEKLNVKPYPQDTGASSGIAEGTASAAGEAADATGKDSSTNVKDVEHAEDKLHVADGEDVTGDSGLLTTAEEDAHEQLDPSLRRLTYAAEDLIDYSDDDYDIEPPKEANSTQENSSRKRSLGEFQEPSGLDDDVTSAKKARSD